MSHLIDYIAVYDQALSDDLIQDCLSYFDDPHNEKGSYQEYWRRCQELTTIDQGAVWSRLRSVIQENYQRYRTEHPSGVLNFSNTVEAPNIFCYEPDSERPNLFNNHADCWNFPTATRQISIIIYLNDVVEGGETTFPDLDYKVTPKKGRILIFPSSFLYIHRGEPPLSGKKYIIVTWIHFDGTGHAYRCHKI